LTLGNRIRKKRKEYSLTLKMLSEKCGISVSFLSDIEHDRRRPSLDRLKDIAGGLDTSVSFLLEEGNNEVENRVGAESKFYFSGDKSIKFREVLQKIDGFDNWSREDREELLTYLKLKEKIRKNK